jgi:radical SAM protein with 4Fe4S-binding SPASM domain
MANILITNRCNRKCSFCFAQKRLSRGSPTGEAIHMSREDIRNIIEFLKRSGDRQLRLLGGEPTLHPEFANIVEEGLTEKFHVHVFTNGMMPQETADFLAKFPSEKVSVLCNVSPQARDSQKQITRLEYALDRLGERVVLGITLTAPEFEIDPLIRMIKRFKVRNRIRIGLAEPIVGADNDFLPLEYYRETGRMVARLAQTCFKENILIGLDCGFTLCMFSEEEIGILTKQGDGFKTICQPIIDIGPNMDIWHCFPLSEVLNTRMEYFNDRKELADYYKGLTHPYRAIGTIPECRTCKHLRLGLCTGGCLAHTINSFSQKPPMNAPKPGGRQNQSNHIQTT